MHNQDIDLSYADMNLIGCTSHMHQCILFFNNKGKTYLTVR